MLSDMWFVLNVGFPVYVLCLIDKNTIFDIQIYATKYKKIIAWYMESFILAFYFN